MNTLKKIFIMSALIAITSVGCSPANFDLNTPSAANTELTLSVPAYTQTASATSTPIPFENQPISPFPTYTHTAPAPNTPIPARDLSTSSTRLVGHWGKYVDGEIDEADQCFFGDVNAGGIGEYYEVLEGNYFEGTYSIRSEDLDSTKVVVLIESDSIDFVLPLVISDDGQSFSRLNSEGFADYMYMDSKTKPDNLSPIAKKYKYE